MATVKNFTHELEIVLLHLGLSLEGAQQDVEAVKGTVVGYCDVWGTKWEWHLPISSMVLVGTSIHNLHKALVILQHDQHVVFMSHSKGVSSDFLFLHTQDLALVSRLISFK